MPVCRGAKQCPLMSCLQRVPFRARQSDVADVWQHLLAAQFERFHQPVGIFRARSLERQIDDAAADLSAGLFELRYDLVWPAAEIDGQRPVDIGGPPPLAG